MRSCKKYLLLLGLLLMAAVGGCGGIGYEETDENKPVTIKGPEGLPTYKTTEYIRQTGKNWKRLEIPGSLVMMLDSGIFYWEI